MKIQTGIALLVTAAAIAQAQVASHAPTTAATHPARAVQPAATDKPVVRVNDTFLTERDVLREMYALFPYARQHNNGFPKLMEPEIRRGAISMIVFDELVYQEAKRRKIAIPRSRIERAAAEIRNQFPSAEEYQEYLKSECKGSEQVLLQHIRRSMLIETLLRSEVYSKSAPSPAELRSYYDQHPQEFQHGETYNIQTISIIPPQGAGAEALKDARKRAEEALRLAKATKTYREFGLLAEKFSDDDWHVNMGDRKTVDAGKLPPPLVEAAHRMQPGQVSGLIQLGPNYTLFRLNARTPAGKTPFAEVKAKLQEDLTKSRTEKLRAALGNRLRRSARIELVPVEQSRR